MTYLFAAKSQRTQITKGMREIEREREKERESVGDVEAVLLVEM
jgi:hypothetical protein